MHRQAHILHPDGRSMPFSEDLVTYLVNRTNPARQFCTGEWIATLDNDALTRLSVLTDEFTLQSAAPHHDDIILCAIQAHIAESGSTFPVDDAEMAFELVAKLAILIALESLVRHKWIELDGRTSLEGMNKLCVRITELGKAHERDFKFPLH